MLQRYESFIFGVHFQPAIMNFLLRFFIGLHTKEPTISTAGKHYSLPTADHQRIQTGFGKMYVIRLPALSGKLSSCLKRETLLRMP